MPTRRSGCMGNSSERWERHQTNSWCVQGDTRPVWLGSYLDPNVGGYQADLGSFRRGSKVWPPIQRNVESGNHHTRL